MSSFLSRLERRVRVRGKGLFRRAYRHRRPAPSDLGIIERILLVRTDKIGDAIVSTPVIQALRDHFPSAEIDMVLGGRNKTAAPLLSHLSSVFVAKKGPFAIFALIRALRARSYDLAIDMQPGDSSTAAIYTAGSSARIKIGFEDSGSAFYDFVIPHPEESRHHVPRLLKLLEPLRIFVPEDSARPAIVLSEASLENARSVLSPGPGDKRPVFMINISGSSPAKFWGVDNFVRLARELNTPDNRVILLSAPNDLGLLKKIAEQSGVVSLEPRSDLMEFAALLSFADLVVSPDSSIVHISAALSKPVVSLTASELVASQWKPWAVAHRTVNCATSIPDISFPDVSKAVHSLMKEVLVSAASAKQATSR